MTIGIRRVLFGVGLVLALGLAANGVLGGVSQLPATHTPGEHVQTYAQFSFGIFGILLPVAILTRRFVRVTVGCWTVAVTVAGATAPVVWGRTSAAIGVGSGAASAAVALGIAWLLRVGAARGAHALDSTT